ncbi:hypothetical protein L218DRAFT_992606 [Marasmius fiardii PR-910]|nr:hypothetical protein L218DRAFT_992606 [Marasmius fiardii PR-910]
MIIAFEVDNTLWSGQLDTTRFSKGFKPTLHIGDNLELVNKRVPRNKSNYQNYITLFQDIRAKLCMFKLLGKGKFAMVYDTPDDNHIVVKVMIGWSEELMQRFLETYALIKRGELFNSGGSNVDQYMPMIAFELCNIATVKQLKAPQPENLSGWFAMSKVEGILLWETRLYKKHPFSVPFQQLLKTVFHLIVDEIEAVVQHSRLEHRYVPIQIKTGVLSGDYHRDAHLANAYFDMQGDLPGYSCPDDLGWEQHTRGDDVLIWSDSEAGVRYTREDFVSNNTFRI